MSTSENAVERLGFTAMVFRSFITQYWPFTAYVLSYATVGLVLGSLIGGWSWANAGLAMLALALGLEGLHAIDLADSDIALRFDSRIQMTVGVLMLAGGGLVGVYLASVTSWAFLGFVAIELFLGLAYNMEWFDGLLHDFDTPSGLLNFGISWGAIPFLAGYFVMAETVTFGALLVSLGVMVDAMVTISMFEVSKPASYEDMNITHSREIDQDVTLMNEVTHRGNKLSMVSWSLLALGFVFIFIL